MARFEAFDRDIRVLTEGLSQEAISVELARFAKADLAAVIASGQGSASYTRFVNGIEGAREESVEAPGPIIYQFSWWGEVIEAALAELVKRSPVRSGRYARSFVVLAGQHPVTDFDAISPGAEVVIFNAQPYTRKIETGAIDTIVEPWHFRTTRSVLRRRFGAAGAFSIEWKFLNLGGGLHPLVPYRLRRSQGRRGRQAGSPLEYPALILNMVH